MEKEEKASCLGRSWLSPPHTLTSAGGSAQVKIAAKGQEKRELGRVDGRRSDGAIWVSVGSHMPSLAFD